METWEIVKTYGPWSLGFAGMAYLAKWILDRFDKWVETAIKLANSLDGLTHIIQDIKAVIHELRDLLREMRENGEGGK